MEMQWFKRAIKSGNSEMSGRCLLKWFHLQTLRPKTAASLSCDVLTLRLGVVSVNTETQYIVDIMSGTQGIAPVMQQMSKLIAIFRKWRDRRELWKS
jgi:hypothetical protein